MKLLQIRKNVTLSMLCLMLFTIKVSALEQIFSRVEVIIKNEEDILTGAKQTAEYLPMLAGKKVALVANHTSMIGKTHLADTLKSMKVNLVKVFAPEHGFRGEASAGEKVASSVDGKTGIPLISLYGDNKKPTAAQLQGIDVVIFDIQDVGARFYTYISTLSYVMEACAEQKIQVIIFDRPNPNGHYVDGPVLEPAFSSFVGMHKVPIVHGMTIGEYGSMVNGEGWLKNKVKCDLKVVKCKGWSHNEYYQLPVPPSPNLKVMNSIYLYPSLCLFEGTIVSIGRGTPTPFQVIGYPGFKEGHFSFTPKDGPGSKDPMYEGKECHGFDLSGFGENFVRDTKMIYLYWVISMYSASENKAGFFTPFFDKLAGTDQLKKQIIAGKTEEEIRKSWQPGLDNFKLTRKKYLLYPDA